MSIPVRRALFLAVLPLVLGALVAPSASATDGVTPSSTGTTSDQAVRPKWIKEHPDDVPQGRERALMAYDQAKERVVMFGGATEPFGHSNETYAWNGQNWRQLPSGVDPPPRSDAMLAYDGDHVVLFGGISSEGPFQMDDTWVLDGRKWSRKHPAFSPPRTAAAAMAYHPDTDQVILFGGIVDGPGTASNATWAWDGRTWTLLHPETSPPDRLHASLAYDPASGDLVLYGGHFGKQLGDTWTWDGTTWTRQYPDSAPRRRSSTGVATFGDHLALYGGWHEGDRADLWVWSGDTWTRNRYAGGPGPRSAHAMAWDAARQEVVLFGGARSPTPYNDTWTLRP